VWSCVVFFVSRVVLCCCGVVLVVSCVMVFLLCVCVCDLLLLSHPSDSSTRPSTSFPSSQPYLHTRLFPPVSSHLSLHTRLRLVDTAEHELPQFEACMALCNLATDAELQARIVSCGGWRTLQVTQFPLCIYVLYHDIHIHIHTYLYIYVCMYLSIYLYLSICK